MEQYLVLPNISLVLQIEYCYIVVMADDTIVLDAISRPKKVTTDAGSVEQFGIDEAIKAEQYLASKRRRGTGLKFHRIIPPGACE